jgi:SulP family sulfate permease
MAVRAVEDFIPAYGWLRDYNRASLSSDLSAGLIVAIMLVPQGMAYALLAGMPPIHGLYASTVPLIIYALFGTSRHLSVGPPALMALLTFASVSALAEPGSEEYVSLALLLAFMAGALQLIVGLLRMGFITNFISHPVLSGFVHASVIVIALSQLKHLVGIPLSGGHSTVVSLMELGRRIGEANLSAVVIGLGGIATLVLLSMTFPRVPGPLVLVAGSTLGVWLLRLNEKGVDIVGEVPQGLPGFSLPPLDLGSVRALSLAALTVAFVGFVESISVAKAIAAREKYKINSDQELRALGLANISTSFSSGFPVAGSFSRTALNHRSGAKSQLSSVAAALVVVVALLFLTRLFYYLPKAALAAIIVVAVFGLINPKEVRRIFEIRRADGLAFLITFALTLLVGVQEGIVLGAVFALLAFVRRTAYPDMTELGYVEEKDAFLGIRSHPEARTYPETLIVRFDAPLYYANVPILEERLIAAVAERPDLKRIVVDCRGVNTIDVTAIEGLEDLVSGYHSRGIDILFSHVKRRVRERLRKAGWDKKFGENLCCYPTTRDALKAVDLLGR